MKAWLIGMVLAGAVTLAACNTVRGLGEDVQSAANATSDAMHGR